MTQSAAVPSLQEDVIRARALDRSYTRGRAYYENGDVFSVTWRDGRLTAKVQGSQSEPYLVQVDFEGNDITGAYCTCPYDWGGDCKHIVAALLFMLHKPEQVDCRPSLADLFTPLNREQLVTLLLELAEDVPEILEPLERIASRLSTRGTASPASSAQPQPPVDLDLLRQQIRANVRAAVQTGHGDDWYDDEFYDSDLEAALTPALERGQALLDAGQARSALVLLETAAQAWDDGIDSLDEYVVEAFEDFAEEFTYPLAELWSEALLSADLTPEERKDWAEKLEEYAESLYGGVSLEMAATAAQQGWDYPPLVAAMQGNITSKGAWEGEVPDYADSLAEIRLRILDQRGQHQEYLNLAQAEGQVMSYLHMLIRLNQIDKAVNEAMEMLTMPDDFLAVARKMAEHGFDEQALSLAKYALTLDETQGKGALAEWLRDQAQASGQMDLALQAAQCALDEHPNLENYRAIQKVTGKQWEQLRPAALDAVARGSSAEDKVAVYLYEKMYPQAMEIVDNTSWYYNITPVIEAVKTEYPEWAFEQCRKRAEGIMDAGRSKDYATAAEWLCLGRDILCAAEMQSAWESYLSHLLKIHHRKYALVPLLKNLQQ